MMHRYKGEALPLLSAVPGNVTQTSRGTLARSIAATRLRVPSSSRLLAWRGPGVPSARTTASITSIACLPLNCGFAFTA